MTSLLVLISLACIAFVIFSALRLSAGKFVLTPGNIYLILLVLFHYPLLSYIESSSVKYALLINLGLLGTIAGMYMGNWKVSPENFRYEMLSRRMRITSDRNFITLICFACAISFLFYGGLPPSLEILSKALSGRNISNLLSDMSRIRADLTKSHYFGGGYAGQGALKIINEISWQLVASLAYLRAVYSRNWIGFIFITLLACLVLYGVGAKGPVAYVIVCVIVVRTLISNISVNKISAYTFVFLAILFLIQSLQVSRLGRVEDQGFVSGVGTVLYERVVAGNGLNTYHVVDLIEGGTLEHQHGNDHFVKFMNALPGVQYAIPYAHTLFWAISEGKPSDKTTYATYSYLGGTYLDFGLIGAFVLSVLVGIVLQILYRLLVGLPRTTLNVAFMAVVSVHLGQIIAGSLISLPATLVAAAIVWLVASSPNFLFSQTGKEQNR